MAGRPPGAPTLYKRWVPGATSSRSPSPGCHEISSRGYQKGEGANFFPCSSSEKPASTSAIPRKRLELGGDCHELESESADDGAVRDAGGGVRGVDDGADGVEADLVRLPLVRL